MAGLSEDLIVGLCPRPCRAAAITRSERRLLSDGTEVVSGEFPPPLCDACPTRDDPEAPIRHFEVRYGFPPTGDVWEVEDLEGETVEGAAILQIVYDA